MSSFSRRTSHRLCRTSFFLPSGRVSSKTPSHFDLFPIPIVSLDMALTNPICESLLQSKRFHISPKRSLLYGFLDWLRSSVIQSLSS